ncbi:MAG: AAA-ATPase fused to superfamily nuclease [Parachlamydiales bacterium]|nr:AAA-ATPase fused to superfamily nuclease [Parachlamydiales bacterium]
MNRKPLPIGISDFKTIIEGGYAYADKTLLVQEFLEKGTSVALIPRPRRFGKTLNLSMLRYFFEKSEEDTGRLFQNLAIWKEQKFREKQGTYPVVFLTFKDNKHASWDETFEHFRIILGEEFQRHRYLVESAVLSPEEKDDFLKIIRKEANPTLYEHSLRFLTKWLYLYHKTKVIVLIDEYDAPAHAAYTGKFYRRLIDFLRNLLSGGLKDNNYLERGALTGILRIAKESIFSGANNISTFSLLNEEFQDKFGLLESEVKVFLASYDLTENLSEITKWYDGYCVGSCKHIYNPWSVLNCCAKKGNILPYWVNSSDNTLMQQCLTQGTSELKTEIEELLQGGYVEKKIEEGFVFTDLEEKPNAIWALLLYSGYLTTDSVLHGNLCRLYIPNAEVKELYKSTILDWFERSLNEHKYRMLLSSLITGDVDTFSQIFQEFVLSSASTFDASGSEPEKIYHAFVLGMLIGLKDQYEVKSNRESGLGRYDVMLIPKNKHDLGIVMEFKKIGPFKKMDMMTAANSALLQIEEKKYASELLDRNIVRILYLAIVFEGKNVLILPKFKNPL